MAPGTVPGTAIPAATRAVSLAVRIAAILAATPGVGVAARVDVPLAAREDVGVAMSGTALPAAPRAAWGSRVGERYEGEGRLRLPLGILACLVGYLVSTALRTCSYSLVSNWKK